MFRYCLEETLGVDSNSRQFNDNDFFKEYNLHGVGFDYGNKGSNNIIEEKQEYSSEDYGDGISQNNNQNQHVNKSDENEVEKVNVQVANIDKGQEESEIMGMMMRYRVDMAVKTNQMLISLATSIGIRI